MLIAILYFLFACYFSAVLGIAGIAKIDSPGFFSSTLRSRYGISARNSVWINRAFPWSELILALLLFTPQSACRIITAFLIALLFFLFLMLHFRSYRGRQSENCSCYGKALKKRGMTTDIISSLLQLLLSTFLVLMAILNDSVSPFYYVIGFILFAGVFGWLLWRTWQRHQYKHQIQLIDTTE